VKRVNSADCHRLTSKFADRSSWANIICNNLKARLKFFDGQVGNHVNIDTVPLQGNGKVELSRCSPFQDNPIIEVSLKLSEHLKVPGEASIFDK
jgi:hypothetical protein